MQKQAGARSAKDPRMGPKGVSVGGGNKKSLIGINWKVEKQSMRNRL